MTITDEYPGMVIESPDGCRPMKLAELHAGPRDVRPASVGMAAPFPVVQNNMPPFEDDAAAVEGTSCMAVIVSGPASVLFMVHAVKFVARYAPLAPSAVLVLSTHCRFAGGSGGDGGGLGGCGGGALGACGGGGNGGGARGA